MDISEFSIPGVFLFTPKKYRDSRGLFMETFNEALFQTTVKTAVNFVQDNHSISARAGTVRGLHYQSPPHDQGKLIRCSAGSFIDIIVDVRKGSPTFGQNIRVLLSADNAKQLWIPPGFIHGFATLEDNTECLYKVTNYYAPKNEGSVMWNDPDLNLDWGVDPAKAIVSGRDAEASLFSEFESPFTFKRA